MEGPKYRMLEDDDEVENPGQNNDTKNDNSNL